MKRRYNIYAITFLGVATKYLCLYLTCHSIHTLTCFCFVMLNVCVWTAHHFLLPSQVKLSVRYLLPRRKQLLHRLLEILQTGEPRPLISSLETLLLTTEMNVRRLEIRMPNGLRCCVVDCHSAQISRLLKNYRF